MIQPLLKMFSNTKEFDDDESEEDFEMDKVVEAAASENYKSEEQTQAEIGISNVKATIENFCLGLATIKLVKYGEKHCALDQMKDGIEHYFCEKDSVIVVSGVIHGNDLKSAIIEHVQNLPKDIKASVSNVDDKFVYFNQDTIIYRKIEKDKNKNYAIGDQVNLKIVKREDNDSYVYRGLEILPMTVEEIMKNIRIISETKRYWKDNFKKESHVIMIKNSSGLTLEFLGCEIIDQPKEINGDEMIGIENKYKLGRRIKFISSGVKAFKIDFTITPKVAGIFTGLVEMRLRSPSGEFKIASDINFEVLDMLNSENIIEPPRVTKRIIHEVEISRYEIPNDLANLIYETDGHNFETTVDRLSQNYESISAQNFGLITISNYKKKLALEEFFEELEQVINFKKLAREQAVFEDDPQFKGLFLKIDGLAEQRPSLCIGDSAIVKKESGDELFKGIITKVREEGIVLQFDETFQHNNQKYDIQFDFSRTRFTFCHHAIRNIHTAIGINALHPEDLENHKQKRPIIDAVLKEDQMLVNGELKLWYDNKLDKYQKNAVVMALRSRFRPAPMILHGPPGTGKTLTLIEFVVQLTRLCPQRKILIATPSNSAADIFLANFMEIDELQGKFLRVVSNNYTEKDFIAPEFSKYCATVTSDINADTSNFKTNANGVRLQIPKSEIRKYQICISTATCLGQFMRMKMNDFYETLIFDEAGQASEPETYIPMMQLSQFGQVILAGDHKQLGPTMLSVFSKHFKLRKSLMERLLLTNEYYMKNQNDNVEIFSSLVCELKRNYRSIESVLEPYNYNFYNGELECTIETSEDSCEMTILNLLLHEKILWGNGIDRKCGVYFINVANGRNRKIEDNCSWYNLAEIKCITNFLHVLSDNCFEMKDVGIITPYALQRSKLRTEIQKILNEDEGQQVKVGTVEDFQGQERHVILLSTVRTNENHFKTDKKFGLGFLACEKRMNVAISRARTLLVVFGKEEIFPNNHPWRWLIDYTKKNQTYFVDDAEH